MIIAGIILAAGRSSRMGRDKALLPYGETTFLESIANAFAQVLSPLVVVLGHHAEEILKKTNLPAGCQVIINENYDSGMLSSLQTAIAALPEQVEAAAFTLVDHPGVDPDTLRALKSALQNSESLLTIPRFEGKRGHPVVLKRTLLNEIALLTTESSPKEVIRAHRAKTTFLDVTDPAVTRDIDTPTDFGKLKVRASSRPPV